jgi:excisionase family DNA binding protein
MKTISGNRIAIPEIAERLAIGRVAVYQLLERKAIPAIRLGRRWIVTRYAYEQWERTCGLKESEPAIWDEPATTDVWPKPEGSRQAANSR